MFPYLDKRKGIGLGLAFVFLANSISLQYAAAQELTLPNPGVMVRLSPTYNPPLLRGIKVNAQNPFRFEFILDKGVNSHPEGASHSERSEESQNLDSSPSAQNDYLKLIKYFLAAVTIPESDLWVNLSPYEKDRIIPDAFGKTEMGRDLLAQDYILKQITASLMYPEDEVGKKFWKRVYEESARKFGNTNIPVNTFNKVWIVPEKAVVYEHMAQPGEAKGESTLAKTGTAYVVESKLKVMLEQDYQALARAGPVAASPASVANQIIREIILPQLTKEINQGQNFAQLRQVYNSLILATWYKKKLKQSILSQVYADKNKVSGISHSERSEESQKQDPSPAAQDDTNVETIYQNYLQSFKKGTYNFIKEEIDPVSQQPIPRKYFSGGMGFAGRISSQFQTNGRMDEAQLNNPNLMGIKVNLQMDSAQNLIDQAQTSEVYSNVLLNPMTVAPAGNGEKSILTYQLDHLEQAQRNWLFNQIPGVIRDATSQANELKFIIKMTPEAVIGSIKHNQAIKDFEGLDKLGEQEQKLLNVLQRIREIENKSYVLVARYIQLALASLKVSKEERRGKFIVSVDQSPQALVENPETLMHRQMVRHRLRRALMSLADAQDLTESHSVQSKKLIVTLHVRTSMGNSGAIVQALRQFLGDQAMLVMEKNVGSAADIYTENKILASKGLMQKVQQVLEHLATTNELPTGVTWKGRSVIIALNDEEQIVYGGKRYKSIRLKGSTYQGRMPVMEPYEDEQQSNMYFEIVQLNASTKNREMIQFYPQRDHPQGTIVMDAVGKEYAIAKSMFDQGLPVALPLGAGEWKGMDFKGQKVGFLILAEADHPIPPRFVSAFKVLWNITKSKISDRSKNAIARGIRQSAQILRKMHQKGFIHGQPHLDQFEWKQNNVTRVHDFTTSRAIKQQVMSREAFQLYVLIDVMRLWASMARNVPEQKQELYPEFSRAILEGYFSADEQTNDQELPNQDFVRSVANLRRVERSSVEEALGMFTREFTFMEKIKTIAGDIYDANTGEIGDSAQMSKAEKINQDLGHYRVQSDWPGMSGQFLVQYYPKLGVVKKKIRPIRPEIQEMQPGNSRKEIEGINKSIAFAHDRLGGLVADFFLVSDGIIQEYAQPLPQILMEHSNDQKGLDDLLDLFFFAQEAIFKRGLVNWDPKLDSYGVRTKSDGNLEIVLTDIGSIREWKHLSEQDRIVQMFGRNLPKGVPDAVQKRFWEKAVEHQYVRDSRWVFRYWGRKSLIRDKIEQAIKFHAQSTAYEQPVDEAKLLLKLSKKMTEQLTLKDQVEKAFEGQLILDEKTGRIRFAGTGPIVKLDFDLWGIRHGETHINKSNGFSGSKDIVPDNQLTFDGSTQAYKVALALMDEFEIVRTENEEIVILSSTLGRSIDTAKPFIDLWQEFGGKAKVIRSSGANEINFGLANNLNEGQLPADVQDIAQRYRQHLDATAQFTGGENFLDVLMRTKLWLEELNAHYAGQTVVLFGHGTHMNAIRVLLGDHRLEVADPSTKEKYIDWRSSKNMIKHAVPFQFPVPGFEDRMNVRIFQDRINQNNGDILKLIDASDRIWTKVGDEPKPIAQQIFDLSLNKIEQESFHMGNIKNVFSKMFKGSYLPRLYAWFDQVWERYPEVGLDILTNKMNHIAEYAQWSRTNDTHEIDRNIMMGHTMIDVFDLVNLLKVAQKHEAARGSSLKAYLEQLIRDRPQTQAQKDIGILMAGLIIFDSDFVKAYLNSKDLLNAASLGIEDAVWPFFAKNKEWIRKYMNEFKAKDAPPVMDPEASTLAAFIQRIRALHATEVYQWFKKKQEILAAHVTGYAQALDQIYLELEQSWASHIITDRQQLQRYDLVRIKFKKRDQPFYGVIADQYMDSKGQNVFSGIGFDSDEFILGPGKALFKSYFMRDQEIESIVRFVKTGDAAMNSLLTKEIRSAIKDERLIPSYKGLINSSDELWIPELGETKSLAQQMFDVAIQRSEKGIVNYSAIEGLLHILFTGRALPRLYWLFGQLWTHNSTSALSVIARKIDHVIENAQFDRLALDSPMDWDHLLGHNMVDLIDCIALLKVANVKENEKNSDLKQYFENLVVKNQGESRRNVSKIMTTLALYEPGFVKENLNSDVLFNAVLEDLDGLWGWKDDQKIWMRSYLTALKDNRAIALDVQLSSIASFVQRLRTFQSSEAFQWLQRNHPSVIQGVSGYEQRMEHLKTTLEQGWLAQVLTQWQDVKLYDLVKIEAKGLDEPFYGIIADYHLKENGEKVFSGFSIDAAAEFTLGQDLKAPFQSHNKSLEISSIARYVKPVDPTQINSGDSSDRAMVSARDAQRLVLGQRMQTMSEDRAKIIFAQAAHDMGLQIKPWAESKVVLSNQGPGKIVPLQFLDAQGKVDYGRDDAIDLIKGAGRISMVRIGPLFFIEQKVYQKLDNFNKGLLGPNAVVMEDLLSFLTEKGQSYYSTATIIEMLKHDFTGKEVIDCGAGNGLLSLAALKLGASHVHLLERNSIELARAHQNLSLNKYAASFTMHLGNMLNADFMNEVERRIKVKMQVRNVKHLAIVSNIGIWGIYPGISNKNSMEFGLRFPEFDLFVGGGHVVNNADTNKEIMKEADLLGQNGFGSLSVLTPMGAKQSAAISLVRPIDPAMNGKADQNIKKVLGFEFTPQEQSAYKSYFPKFADSVMGFEHFKYYYAIQKLVREKVGDEAKVFYAGAGVDLANVMVATGANEFYMVGQYNRYGQQISAASFKEYLESGSQAFGKELWEHEGYRYVQSKRKFGFGSDGDYLDKSIGLIYESLMRELISLGIDLNDIEVFDSEGGFSIKFMKNKKLFIFHFVHTDDLTQPGHYTPALKEVINQGYDIYFQNAGLELSQNFHLFIGAVSKGMKSGGVFLTDNYGAISSRTFFKLEHLLNTKDDIQAIQWPKELRAYEYALEQHMFGYSEGYGFKKSMLVKIGDRIQTTQKPMGSDAAMNIDPQDEVRWQKISSAHERILNLYEEFEVIVPKEIWQKIGHFIDGQFIFLVNVESAAYHHEISEKEYERIVTGMAYIKQFMASTLDEKEREKNINRSRIIQQKIQDGEQVPQIARHLADYYLSDVFKGEFIDKLKVFSEGFEEEVRIIKEEIDYFASKAGITLLNPGEDSAMYAGPGGIDLTSDQSFQIKRDPSPSAQDDKRDVQFKISPDMLKQLQDSPGFTPVIIEIQPMTDLRSFLGIVDHAPLPSPSR